MHFSLPVLSLLSALATTATAQMVIGSDGPQPAATYGHVFNHAAIRSANLTASKAFYGSVLGMRELFTLTTSAVTVMQLGYPSPVDETAQHMVQTQGSRAGKLELLHVTGKAPETGPVGRLSHLAWTVKDVQATQERMVMAGAKILKKTGEDEGLAAVVKEYFGIPAGGVAAVTEFFRPVLFVRGPDGVLIEIIQY
ncbi:Glyoxalase/Bleomycin resistance protein/Dihydroxybiphenyl dioxygenase [Geopyxis carbonaria]|nr:Glyoxalase/Bleomycin resistance protein/Dihydroxybiphenyl dioxygenase [Geopyxis carbonaria]